MRRLLLASAVALACVSMAAPFRSAKDGARIATVRAVPDWVKRSNERAQPLLKAEAEFAPESASFFGLQGYDDRVADLGPGNGERLRAAMRNAKEAPQGDLKTEENPNVRQDLDIMIGAADRRIEGSELDEKLTLPFTDVGQLVRSWRSSRRCATSRLAPAASAGCSRSTRSRAAPPRSRRWTGNCTTMRTGCARTCCRTRAPTRACRRSCMRSGSSRSASTSRRSNGSSACSSSSWRRATRCGISLARTLFAFNSVNVEG
jgi:hypothetical protein